MARILLCERAGEASIMSAAISTVLNQMRHRRRGGVPRIDTTLLELVQTIAEDTDDDREIVATVLHLLRSRRVRLIGSFRGRRIHVA
jgi:hypothetical protein